MRHIMMIALIPFLAMPLAAQEAEPNEDYEQLKVLEPLIGTWHAKGIVPDTGKHYEMQMKRSWTNSKRMIEFEVAFKQAATPEKLSKIEKWAVANKSYILWNHNTGRIEQYLIDRVMGRARVNHMVPQGDGVFRLVPISATGLGTADVKFTVSGKTQTLEITNWKGEKGEEQPDSEVVLTKQD